MCEILPAQLGEDRAYAFLSARPLREIAEGAAPRRGDRPAARRAASRPRRRRCGRWSDGSRARVALVSERAGASGGGRSAARRAAPRSAASCPGLATAVVVASEDRGAAADFRALLAPAAFDRPPGRRPRWLGGGVDAADARARRRSPSRARGAAEARASRPSDARGAGVTPAQARVRHAPVFTSADVVGLEVGGAVKNVLALAAGMAEGLDLGTNAVTALATLGL
ncbi:hypothetical protein JL722_8859 [Aureococcus anophagefferens]|nr:hypothetical protein JL722_8859 [Aureococcus anophagefferens]